MPKGSKFSEPVTKMSNKKKNVVYNQWEKEKFPIANKLCG
jgi:hypothetical protein